MTKIRALDELSDVVFAPPSSSTTDNTGNSNEEKEEEYTRPEKIASLIHLTFLHETKLGYDNHPSVRAGSYKALVAMRGCVPKAWNGLFLGDDSCSNGGAANTAVGMAWCSARGDPSAEVGKYSREFVNGLISPDGGDEMMPPSVQTAVLNYCSAVLGCKRANNLQDVINPVSASFSATSDNQSSGKDKKNKGGNSKAAVKNAEAAAAVAESEREEMEERYERVMLSALIGLGSLVEIQPENDNVKQYTSIEAFPESASITRLMSSSRGPFRRQSYNLVSKFCQFAPSLVQPSSESSKCIALASLLPNLLSGEKDSSNFVALLELVLSYLSMLRNGPDNNPWESMDAAAFVKSLSKALRKACCGAPATSWGQMILPIIASLPSGDEYAVMVVESLVSRLVMYYCFLETHNSYDPCYYAFLLVGRSEIRCCCNGYRCNRFISGRMRDIPASA